MGVTGGHHKNSETPYEGIITEIKEELGIDISNKEISEFNSGCDGKKCYKMYHVCLDLDIDNMKIQKEELTQVKWFSIDELNDMIKKNILNDDQISFFYKCTNFLNKNVNNKKNSIHKIYLNIYRLNFLFYKLSSFKKSASLLYASVFQIKHLSSSG